MKHFLLRYSSIVFILLLAGFFRLYRLSELQFWSVDDEIFWAVIRRMVESHTVTLVSPNGTLGISLGSFFHLLSLPLYYLSSPDKILLAGSFLGIATTLVVYFAGKELVGKNVGLLASFFYSASFIASLADRRWWPLTPDPLLAALSLFSAAKIAKGKTVYFLPLCIAASFAWHADPSLAVLTLGSVAVLLVYRSKLKLGNLLPGLGYLVLSILPLVIFELRHPKAISGPALALLSRPILSAPFGIFDVPAIVWTQLTNAFFPTVSSFTELNFHCQDCPSPFFYPFTGLFLLAIIVFGWNRKLVIPYLYLASYFIGVTIYKFSYGASIYQTYSIVILPIFFIIIATSLKKTLVPIFIAFFLFTNFNSLLNSRMRYPLKDKLAAVDNVISETNSSKISLEVVEGGQYFQGFAGLFLFRGICPVNSSYFKPWDWYYRAYGLYTCRLEPEPFLPQVTFSQTESFKINTSIRK